MKQTETNQIYDEENELEGEIFTLPQLIVFLVLALPTTAFSQAFKLSWDWSFAFIAVSALIAGFAPQAVHALQTHRRTRPGSTWGAFLRATTSSPHPVMLPQGRDTAIEGTFFEPDEAPEEIRSQDNEEIEEEDEVYHPTQHKRHFFLGLKLFPHANRVFSNRIAILGMPGAGKSNTVAVLAEEIARFGGPLIIFDHKPEYTRVCERPYFPRPFQASIANVTPETAFAFGQRIMNERLQVVLNLRSYKNDNAAALVMIGIIEGVWAWEEALENDDRIPCTFFLDEAHYWLPENEQLATVSKKQDKETGVSLFTQLQQAFFNLVNGGRSLGMGVVISTQRPANVDKRAIAVAEWKFLLRANMPNDLKVYAGFGIDADMAQALSSGEAYVVGPGDIKGVYQLRKRNSPDDAKTPGLEALQRTAPMKEQRAHYQYPPSSPTSVTSASLQTTEDHRSSLRSTAKTTEGDSPLRQLSEREMRIGALFFGERRMNFTAIMKELYPGVTGGEKYQKASAEIADAIRTYGEAQQIGA